MFQPLRLFSWLSAFLLVLLLSPFLFLFVVFFQEGSASSFASLGEMLAWVGRSLLLTLGVVIGAFLWALPLSYWSSRYRLWMHRFWAWGAILPLAIPSYLLAYAFLSLGGDYGFFAKSFGISFPSLTGYWGSWWILSLATAPYFYLNLKTAWLHLNSNQEEAAVLLGASKKTLWFRVYLPHLIPAISSGSLLVALHVLANFSVVSLMKYPTISSKIYIQFSSSLSLPLLGGLSFLLALLTGVALWLDYALLRAFASQETQGKASRKQLEKLPSRSYGVYVFFGLYIGVGFFLPCIVMGSDFVHWLHSSWKESLPKLVVAFQYTAKTSFWVAFLASLGAFPFAYLSSRWPSWKSHWMERISFLGYSIPSLAFALGWVFLSLRYFSFAYQSWSLLVLALSLHFLSEANGPWRTALQKTSPRLEEMGLLLGRSRWNVLFSVLFPNVRKAFFFSFLFVFLSTTKELPISVILSPLGYSSLALGAWDAIENALFAEASPYALLIVACSLCSIFFFTQEKGEL